MENDLLQLGVNKFKIYRTGHVNTDGTCLEGNGYTHEENFFIPGFVIWELHTIELEVLEGQVNLNPISPRGGHYDSLYHESVWCIHMVRGRFPKIHDFAPFAICQDLVKSLLTFFFKKFEKLDVKNFGMP